MELLAWMFLMTTTLIASSASYRSPATFYVVPNVSKHEFFLDGWLNAIGIGNKYFQHHCGCGINKTNEYIIVNCSSPAGRSSGQPENCPKNTTLIEYSSVSGYQAPITKGRTKSVTKSTDSVAESLNESGNKAVQSLPINCYPYPWFIIGSQFVVIIVLLVAYLRQRQRCSLDNIPLPINNQLATPIKEIVDPTPKPAFEPLPLPSETGYVVPIVPNATLHKGVYEDHKLDKNDVYVSVLEEHAEDPNKVYYSTIKI